MDLEQEIINAFFKKYGDEDYKIYVQEVGKTLQNLISHERAITLTKAIEFTIQYLHEKN